MVVLRHGAIRPIRIQVVLIPTAMDSWIHKMNSHLNLHNGLILTLMDLVITPLDIKLMNVQQLLVCSKVRVLLPTGLVLDADF